MFVMLLNKSYLRVGIVLTPFYLSINAVKSPLFVDLTNQKYGLQGVHAIRSVFESVLDERKKKIWALTQKYVF